MLLEGRIGRDGGVEEQDAARQQASLEAAPAPRPRPRRRPPRLRAVPVRAGSSSPVASSPTSAAAGGSTGVSAVAELLRLEPLRVPRRLLFAGAAAVAAASSAPAAVLGLAAPRASIRPPRRPPRACACGGAARRFRPRARALVPPAGAGAASGSGVLGLRPSVGGRRGRRRLLFGQHRLDDAVGRDRGKRGRPAALDAVLLAERPHGVGGGVELMGDPGVRRALVRPRANAVELRLESGEASGHGEDPMRLLVASRSRMRSLPPAPAASAALPEQRASDFERPVADRGRGRRREQDEQPDHPARRAVRVRGARDPPRALGDAARAPR